MKTRTDFTPTLSATLRLCTAVLFGLMLSGLTQAAPLTDDHVQSFIDSLRDTETLDDVFPELEEEIEPEDEDMTHPISSSISILDKHPEAKARLAEIVEDYGFDDIGQWAEVGDRVFIAMMAISFEQLPPEQRQMIESMANPDTDSGADDATQAGMREMARSMKEMIEIAENAPKEDVEAVRPYIGQLESL